MIGIDLFSGAGGMSLGASLAGIDVRLVVEADKCAALTYLCNHKPKHGLFNNDIRKFSKTDIDSKGAPVVIFGGPPCQGFSTSNQKTRSASNSENWLFQEFIRVIKEYMPDWIVFENVKGILETEKGLFVEKIVNAFEYLGYEVHATVLNASDYGVPQNRARFFIVGSLHKSKFLFPDSNRKKKVTVKQAINDLPMLENGASTNYFEYKKVIQSNYSKKMRSNSREIKGSYNNLVTRNCSLVIERYSHIPQGGNWENIPDKLMKNYTDSSRCHTGIYHRLNESKPSVVIGNYRKNMLIHPTQNRGLSVREAARLQSFPDWFMFKGSIGFQQQQVGNAVPPLLAQVLFESIINS